MTGEDLRTEKEKEAIERISKDARRRAREESYQAFLEYLQKELQKILPEKTVRYETKFSPADFFSKEYLSLHLKEITEDERQVLNMTSFEECDLKYAFGIFPRQTSKRILDIDPLPSEALHCKVYNANTLSILKESVAHFAWVLDIKNLTIRKMYGEGNLSLVTQGGELSPTTQPTGGLTIVEQ